MYQVSIEGFRWLDWQFISSFPSRFPERAGIKSALVGTIWLISLVALISIPVGVSTALYLEEFAGKGKISKIIEVNIANLAGVPSIVYGIPGPGNICPFFRAGAKPDFRRLDHESADSTGDYYCQPRGD